MSCMAQVTMNTDLETEDLVEQFKYRCCVCGRVTTTEKIRTCRNPTCLQTLCSTWCSILHNKRTCPTASEIRARVDTIYKHIGYEQDRRGRSPAQGDQKGGRGGQPRNVHRSRSGLRNPAPHASLASYTHGTATHISAAVQRGRP